MALESKDIETLRLLLREEVLAELKPLRKEMSEMRNEMLDGFDGLYKRDETREQEYGLISKQVSQHDERVETLEKKLA